MQIELMFKKSDLEKLREQLVHNGIDFVERKEQFETVVTYTHKYSTGKVVTESLKYDRSGNYIKTPLI